MPKLGLPAGPEVVANIQIIVTRDEKGSHTSVDGFPNNREMTLLILHQAAIAVIRKFMEAGKKGELESQRIIKPNGPIDSKLLKGLH